MELVRVWTMDKVAEKPMEKLANREFLVSDKLEKVSKMVRDGVDCSEVLIQLSAVKASVNSTGKLILKDHIEHCLVDAVEHGDHQTVEELNRAIDQFIK